MEEPDRNRMLAYFDRLGETRVRLYTAVNCERFLGDWQVRELADQWLAAKQAERESAPIWHKLLRRR